MQGDGRVPRHAFFPIREIDHRRPAWEGVVGQEAHVAEVAVGVKIAVAFAHVGQPINHGFAAYLVLFCNALVRGLGFKLLPLVLEPDVFIAEPLEGLIEVLGESIHDRFQVVIGEADAGQLRREGPASRRQNLRLGCPNLGADLVQHPVHHGQPGLDILVIGHAQELLGLGQDTVIRQLQHQRVHVRFQQHPVVQQEHRRCDGPGNDPLREPEEILVVRGIPAVGAAERCHDGRLPVPTGAALALGVIGRRRRHIPQVDRR